MYDAPPTRLPTPPLAMDEHTLQEQQAALNLAALCNTRNTEGDNLKALTDAMVAGLSGTGVLEIIAKGSMTKLVESEGDANDADMAMLDLIIQLGKEAEAAKQRALAARVVSSTNGDVDMVEIKKAPSSSPPPAPTPDMNEEALIPRDENQPAGKRKLNGKDGFLGAENADNKERAKRSRSR